MGAPSTVFIVIIKRIAKAFIVASKIVSLLNLE